MKPEIGKSYPMRGGGQAQVVGRRKFSAAGTEVWMLEGRVSGVWGLWFWHEDGRYSCDPAATHQLDLMPVKKKGGQPQPPPKASQTVSAKSKPRASAPASGSRKSRARRP